MKFKTSFTRMRYRFLEFQPASKLNLFGLENDESAVFCYKPLLDATVNFCLRNL